jgi:hypothetical protein
VLQLVVNWRHARQNNTSATSTIWQTKKMPSQNNDLALLVMKHQFHHQFAWCNLSINCLSPVLTATPDPLQIRQQLVLVRYQSVLLLGSVSRSNLMNTVCRLVQRFIKSVKSFRAGLAINIGAKTPSLRQMALGTVWGRSCCVKHSILTL